MPKPVTAAVNGPCAEVGLLLAAMCDLRFAAPDARFTAAYTRIGLPAGRGLSWQLPRLVGPRGRLRPLGFLAHH